MKILKNGTIVTDHRLDRIPSFDRESRKFCITSRLETSAPIQTKMWELEHYLDQGQEGACVGFGISHELLATPKDAPYPYVNNEYAKEQIYWEAQKIDPWPGGAYPGASPFYEGTSVLAGVKIAKSIGWFDSYYWAFSLNDLMKGVSQEGPAVLGVNWYEGMMDTDAAGYIRPTGSCIGGHCICAIGINKEDEYFTLHNSWGDCWGDDGRCRISFADMRRLLNENGEACFFVGRHVKLPR